MLVTKKLCMIALVCFTCVACAPRPVHDVYQSGSTKAEGQTQSGRQVGVWTYYYDDRTLKARGSWVNDYQDGAWAYYYKNGAQKHTGTYAKKLRVGTWSYWYDNGQLYCRGAHHADRQQGLWEYFNTDGSRFANGYFIDNQKHGPWVWLAGKTAETVPDNGVLYHGERIGSWFVDGSYVNKGIPAGMEEREVVGADGAQWLLLDAAGVPQMATLRHTDNRLRAAIDYKHDVLVSYYDDGSLRAVVRGFSQQSGQSVRAWHAQGQPAVDGDNYWTATGTAVPHLDIITADGSLDAIRDIQKTLGADVARMQSLRALPAPSEKKVSAESVEELIVSATEQPALTPIVHIDTMWTKSEEYKANRLVKMYSDAFPGGGDGYSGLGAGKRRMNSAWMKKSLPQTRFFTPEGSVIDFNSFKGKKNICVVVMRGFAGQVCIYCSTQTRALIAYQAEFAAKNCELMVVYPGSAESIPSFIKAVESLGGDTQGLTLLLDVNLSLVKKLNIVKDLSRPASLIIDTTGTVVYAYAGKNMGDRPSAKELLNALDEVHARGK